MSAPRTDIDDRDAAHLDDRADREELRQRYYGLLEELRTILPGVQVLVAFLLTVPFANRFDRLDPLGRSLFLVAMLSSILAVVLMLTPTVFHRVSSRQERSVRLVWAIRTLVVGLACLAVALLSALLCVSRFVFGTATGIAVTAAIGVAILGLWLVLPLTHRALD